MLIYVYNAYVYKSCLLKALVFIRIIATRGSVGYFKTQLFKIPHTKSKSVTMRYETPCFLII